MAAKLWPPPQRVIARSADFVSHPFGRCEARRSGCTVAPMSRRQLLDYGIPLVLAVVGLIELATSSDIDAPWPIQIVFALGTTVPLIWRRRAPLLVLVIVFASLAIADETYGIANNASS